MLQFIIGSKGSGKTTYIHKLLGSLVRNDGAQAMLIVPKQFTFESDRGILAELGPKDGCMVEVLSFSRLADVVLKTYGGITKPILSDGANAVMMSLALESVKDRLDFFARHSGNISFVNKMLSEIKTLKQSVITAENLKSAALRLPSGMLREKMLETALIYEAYDALVQQSFFDDSDLLTKVYEVLLGSDFFDGKIVAIDAFSRFSGQELKLIERMLVSAKDVYITACTDNIENFDESSIFATPNKTIRQIAAIARKNAVGIRKTVLLTDEEAGFDTYAVPELRHLEKNLYKPDFAVFEGKASSAVICEAPTVRDECDYAARQIKMLMRTGQYRCRDIAVVYRSSSLYEREIRQSLKKYSVPIFEDKRQPIENESLIIAVRSMLAIYASGFSTDNLMRFAKTGLAGLTRDEIAEAENYALMWNLSAKDWKNEWTSNPDGYCEKETDVQRERLAAINETREKLVSPLISFCEAMKDSGGRDSMRIIYEFLADNGINENLKEYAISLEEQGQIELAVEQEQIWDILMQVLDQIAGVLGDKKVSAKRLCEIFDLVISTQSLGKLPDGFDEVYICDADRVQTKMTKVVFLLGANSGVFPQTYSNSSLFGDFEKDKIKEVLPDLKDDAKQAAVYERFLVYNSICCAREKLFVTYAISDLQGEKMTKSEIVYMLEKILPQCERVFSVKQSLEQLIESEKSAFELMARKWNEDNPQANALKAYFASKDEYKGKIQAIERITKKGDQEFENKDYAKQLFGANIMTSATRLEDYSKCPFMYFCKDGLHAEPRKIARLDPASSGSIVHEVLDKLLYNHPNGEFVSLDQEQTNREIQEYLDEYIETKMGGSKDKSDRFKYLYSRLFKILQELIARLKDEFSSSDFVPCDFELKIDHNAKIKPFRVELDEGYVELRGQIDRVDKMVRGEKQYIRVVDYKTGDKAFLLSDIMAGLQMQMVLYLVSIWRGGEKYYGGPIVPSGVLYYPARFSPYDVDRNDDETARTAAKLKDVKMSGMILDDSEVIYGMDKQLSGRYIKIKLIKKTGELSGTFINLKQLGYLAKKLDGIIAEMGNNLHSGRVPASPIHKKTVGGTVNACEYCDFGSVCMSKGENYRYVESPNHDECLTLLEQEAQENGENLD